MLKKKGEQYNLLPIAQDYFNTIFGDITQMKALILDQQTSGIISIIYTQSKLYKHDVYLIQKIEDVNQKLMHLKAVYFIRPNKENLNKLKGEISNPHFKEYHLFFTNEIAESMIAQLAEVDTSDRIKNLQQVYLDYYAIGRNIFSLKILSTIGLMKRRENWNDGDKSVVNRISDGLISVAMSLRVLPQVRYLSESESCSEVARKISKKFQEQLMKKPSDYPKDQRVIMIITERKQDVVTPLLTPWTYEAMLHQFFGIFNNKIDIKYKQKILVANDEQKKMRDSQPIKQKEKRQFVLSQIEDDFFKKNVYCGFGQLANNIKTFINDVSSKRNKTVKLQSLEDMHDALSKLPQLNSLSAAVEKHVTLSCQISSQIQKGLIFQVSKIEQDLICQDNRKDNIESIWKILKNETVQYYLKLKLVLLFSIKYPNDKEIKQFLSALSSIHQDKSLTSLIPLIQQYQNGRKSDLFHNKNLKKKAQSYFDRIFSDVPNVYTQHRPYLFQNVIPQFIQDRVKQNDYRTAFPGRQSNSRNKPLIILFYVGGVTYTEAKQAEEFEDAKIIVGGTFIHNSKTFVSEIIQLQGAQGQLL